MIRILLAHPSRLVSDSLRTALDDQEDVYVVGCASTAEELHFLLPHGNIVLLGTELGGKVATNLIEEIRTTHPQTKILVMGVDDNPDLIIRYVEAGAAGYILQNESLDDVVQKVQAAHDEKAIVSPSMAAAMMERLMKLANLETPLAFIEARETQLDELTNREEEVLTLITEGRTNQEIADKLIIECGTVKNHVHNILKKLEVNNRHEAASIYQIHSQSAMAMAA
ncbi:MAG: response regulator transcription factor [Anaerolineales bacterium]|nr:response regulator transcription factor [Anaerolineales bacterium]